MKCILLNSADDIGNPGPDFKHGWGVVNAYRAVKILEASHYFNGSVSQNGTNNHLINIPSGVQQVKIMVYWHDKEGSPSASTALVNDINTEIISPNGTVYQPFVLNSNANSSILNQNATYGIDNLNNMEQIVINNPTSGSYSLLVSGDVIPYGPQDYYVSEKSKKITSKFASISKR